MLICKLLKCKIINLVPIWKTMIFYCLEVDYQGCSSSVVFYHILFDNANFFRKMASVYRNHFHLDLTFWGRILVSDTKDRSGPAEPIGQVEQLPYQFL